MDDEYRKWIEIIFQEQRDLEDMAKQREKESEARIRDAEEKIKAACVYLGITQKDWASIWQSGAHTLEEFDRAVKNLKNARRSK